MPNHPIPTVGPYLAQTSNHHLDWQLERHGPQCKDLSSPSICRSGNDQLYIHNHSKPTPQKLQTKKETPDTKRMRKQSPKMPPIKDYYSLLSLPNPWTYTPSPHEIQCAYEHQHQLHNASNGIDLDDPSAFLRFVYPSTPHVFRHNPLPTPSS